MSSKASKPKLSKGILEMKFMQRTKAKVKKECEDAEGRQMYSNEITEKMLNSNTNFIMEPSFMFCENLIEGRLSFRGMNPELERMLELEREAEKVTTKHVQPADVSNKEMVAFYHAQQAPAASKTMAKKFQTKMQKRKNNETVNEGKKKKFLKPRDGSEEDDN